MIKTSYGRLEVEGTLRTIKADLSVIVHGIYNNIQDDMSEEEAKEFIFDAVNRALESEDELKKEAMAGIKTGLADFFEGLAKTLKGQGEE